MHKRRRTLLTKGMREIIIRVRHYFEMEFQNGGPIGLVNRPVDRTAVATGISRRRVCRVTREIYGFSNEEDEQRSSNKTKGKPKRDYNKEMCRVFIYAYDKTYPYDTRTQLKSAMRKAGVYFGGKASFYKMLLELGVPLCNPRPRKKLTYLQTDEETDVGTKNQSIIVEGIENESAPFKGDAQGQEDPLMGCSYIANNIG